MDMCVCVCVLFDVCVFKSGDASGRSQSKLICGLLFECGWPFPKEIFVRLIGGGEIPESDSESD